MASALPQDHQDPTIPPSLLPSSPTLSSPGRPEHHEATDLLDFYHPVTTLPSGVPAATPADTHPTTSRITSLSARSRAFSSASTASSTSIKRKPLPVNASPLATRFSSGVHLAATALELPEEPFARPFSVDSPTLYDFPSVSPPVPPKNLERSVPRSVPSSERVAAAQTASTRALNDYHPSPSSQRSSAGVPVPKHATLRSESALTSASESTGPWFSDTSSASHPASATMSIFSNKPHAPHHITVPETVSRTYSNDSVDSQTTIQKPVPKSPGGSKLGSFFGWGGTTSPESSTTTFSDKSYSPIPSPIPSENFQIKANASNVTRGKPTSIDVPMANAHKDDYFGSANLQVPLATPTAPLQVEEMENELKDISSELASSIRREMDLEDLVERLQAEAQSSSAAPGRRTSDYFSDSGTSSVRYGDSDSKQDDLDRMLRKTEQEKASIRLELTNKVQEERLRRKNLETQIRTLEEKVSRVDLASINSMDASGRVKDLENQCEDLRRKLAEERQVKDNFEDLLTALKSELLISHNERDNLRDEIVPQLRARVEGLEAQAVQHERLSYEQSKMQHELQSAISGKGRPASLSRSASVKQGLTRSGSVKGSVKGTESREVLIELVKDVELQRDALHRALKSLLDRQEHQNREHQKKIKQLEVERDRALSNEPKRLAYDKEVANLRAEINTLRRRADDAIEQKWQCEKGLSGLKMDLDRAEQEIGSLRSLLEEKDILISPSTRDSSGSRPGSSHASSESLERAYKTLQEAYVESLEKVKALELSGSKDEETARAMKQLEQSLADAISERDLANQAVDTLRSQSDSFRESEKAHLGEEQALADELRASAKRVEELAAQVRQQLASNSTLRQRLTQTIERGEQDQRMNSQKITLMQDKLKSLEDQLMAAQQASEDAIQRHEGEIREIKENHNTQLQRVKDGMRSPRLFAPKTPISPMFANSTRAPNILMTTSGKAMSVSEHSKMDFLKQRVMDLESALSDADKEMEEVVGRMNVAQMEVMELQNEREEAVRETKRLQKMIEAERIRAFEGRFATLSS